MDRKLSGELEYRIRYDVEHDLFHAQNVFNDEYIKPTFIEYVQKLEKENKLLGKRCNQLLKDKGNLTDECKELEAQIEKMKCCGNCKCGYCSTSSFSEDKEGNRTFHNWNETKKEYCDVGKNGKYQCWELRR